MRGSIAAARRKRSSKSSEFRRGASSQSGSPSERFVRPKLFGFSEAAAVNTTRLEENLARIRGKIAAAAARSGRPAESVTLVAVTKYVPAPVAAALVDLGCRDLGEARPQELWSKSQMLAEQPVRWHLIGHLQRNKIERTLLAASLIHSADSLRLISADRCGGGSARSAGRGVAGSKCFGRRRQAWIPSRRVGECVVPIAAAHHVEVRGLMAMAGLGGDDDDARRALFACATSAINCGRSHRRRLEPTNYPWA